MEAHGCTTDKCLQITTRGLTPVTSTRPDPRTPHSRVQVCRTAIARPRPPAPVIDQGPQFNSPLLIPPLNQLAQLRAARAHGENAENAQEEAAQGLRMLDQRRITAAIMKYWAPHVEARTIGPPHHRGKVMHPRQLSQTIPCISRTVVGQQGHSLFTSFYARRRGTRVRAIQAQISQLDPPRVSQLFRAHHGLLHVQSIQQGS